MIAQLRQGYYSDTRYDVLPALQTALRAAYAEFERGEECIPVALVIEGLEASALATEEGSLWLVRAGTALDLLARRRPARALGSPGSGYSGRLSGPELCWARRRLVSGDTLVLTTRQAAHALTSRALRGALRKTSASGAARHLARSAARTGGGQHPPVTVIRLPGFSPVPEFEPSRGRMVARQSQARGALRPPRERSPIWVAVLLAVLAVAVSLWLRKPGISRQDLRRLLISRLTPAPSTTALPSITRSP